jgi:hypothetical protein
MTTFKEIRGQLQFRTRESADPANPQEGQIWYNSYYWSFERLSHYSCCLGELEVIWEQVDLI